MKNPECLGRFTELASVLVRLDHFASFIVNANHIGLRSNRQSPQNL